MAQSNVEADMTVKITRDDMTAQDLRAAAGKVKDGKMARRLLAIALVLEGASRKHAAERCGMDRQTLRDWVHRYNGKGIDGLASRGGGGVRPRLTLDQMAQLAAWVEAGPDSARDGVVRWRRADLARRIEAEFGVRFHERRVGNHLAKLGFRRLSVRPEHPRTDPAAQTAFKKTSQAS
jgi:transposase